VVVPVYDVEEYLADCLDSLLAQTCGELQVVLVDDGSTDSSASIAAAYTADHPDWVLVRTDNHGLGAARNRGVQEATGTYLAFADSDDLVPDFAYELMLSTVESSGSDFVVGSVQQLIGDDLVEPEFLRTGVAQRRLGVRAADVPAITRNVFAWNKVFRRSFYDRAEIRFPEGVRYEVQPATMRAYLVADGFDIVRRPVYTWRVRAAGTSITQGRGRLADLEDRLTTKQLTSDVVREHADPVVRDYWGRIGVVGDLPVYFAQIPHVDDAYWDRLVSGLRALLDGYPPIEQSGLRLPQRLVGWLVVNDRRSDAEKVLAWVEANPGPLRLRVHDDGVVAVDLPVASDPHSGVPDDVRRLGPHELAFDARLVEVHWEESTLVVSGWAVVRGAPTPGVQTEVRAVLDAEGSAIPGAVTRWPAPDATRWIDRGDQVYDDSGFTARFDLGDRDAAAGLQGRELGVTVEVEVARIHRSGPLRSVAAGLDTDRLPTTDHAVLAWRPDRGLMVVLR
jgi:CDP-glycerol glycerophosphotransferase